MAWIRTAEQNSPNEAVGDALARLSGLYPPEYQPVGLDGMVGSHSLLPSVMYHAFATFGELMSAEMPLSRAQQEMIATVVSATNRCEY